MRFNLLQKLRIAITSVYWTIRGKAFRQMVVASFLIDAVRPRETLCGRRGKRLEELTFDDWDAALTLIERDQEPAKVYRELLKIFFGIDGAGCHYLYAFSAIRYALGVLEQTGRYFEALNAEPDLDWLAAGGDKLQAFGRFNIKMQIGRMFNRTPAEVGQMPIIEIFLILKYENVKNVIEQRYIKIKQQNGSV